MEKKYDIGILTFWGVPNYGTFAQAYALLNVLQKLNPDRDVKQIAHLDSLHFDFYYNTNKYYRIRKHSLKSRIKHFFDKRENRVLLLTAYNEMKHTENITVDNVSEYSFRKIFLGSDIIWDFSQEIFNNDPLLFGNGFIGEINSYGASFGTILPDRELPAYALEAIKKMANVSVRDINSFNIIKKATGKNAEVVLDPTWLWDFENDNNVIEPKEKDYILVYGQDFTPRFIDEIIEFAHKNNKMIIALSCNSDRYKWSDKMIPQSDLHPFEWLGYFKYASAIATSTFHGFTFGLIFNKCIAFCKNDFVMSKLDVFMKELNLLELFTDDSNGVDKMLTYNWDYDTINSIIERKKMTSMNFLKKACDL